MSDVTVVKGSGSESEVGGKKERRNGRKRDLSEKPRKEKRMKMPQLTPGTVLASPRPAPSSSLQMAKSTETDRWVAASPEAVTGGDKLSHEKKRNEARSYSDDEDAAETAESEWGEELTPLPQLPPPEEVLKTALFNVTAGLLNAFGY